MDAEERARLRERLDDVPEWAMPVVVNADVADLLGDLDAAEQGRVLAVQALTKAMNDHLAAIAERDAARVEAARLRDRIDALRDAMRTARDEALAGAGFPTYRRSARLEGVAHRLQQRLKLDAAEDARAALAATANVTKETQS